MTADHAAPSNAHSCDKPGCHSHPHNDESHSRLESILTIIAACTLIVGFGLSVTMPQSQAGQIGYWISFVCGGTFATFDALKSLLRAKLTIDTLMVAAGVGAAFIGHVAEGALLLTLFSIGHTLEHLAMSRARRSIEALADMRPNTALRVNPANGEAEELRVSEIKVGDLVLIKPDSRIAVDGVVVSGESSVNQAAITGESIPVDKTPLQKFQVGDRAVDQEHQVFAGTMNGAGAMHVRVTRSSDESTLSRLVKLIDAAKADRSPTQRLTDTFERWFVPSVFAIVAVLPFACFVISETFTQSLYRAMAVLVAASPCALAISTPGAVLSAIARAGQEGVLIKGGGPLELLGQIDSIAFDKTGTLTLGKPSVIDVRTVGDCNRCELLRESASVQRLSDHPLSQAVVRAFKECCNAAEQQQVLEDTAVPQLSQHHGQGLVATWQDRRIALGNLKLYQQSTGTLPKLTDEISTIDHELREQGQTTAIVSRGDHFLGVIGMRDVTRPAAKQAIQSLHDLGMKSMVMLSGDHQAAAQAIGGPLELDTVLGGLMPEDKVQQISAMAKRGSVAMVGDGANDAPAMAAATVSIAMGAAGSPVALETADIALMGDDLTKLPFLFGLGKAATRIIRQNLFISLGMILFLVPATIFGLKLGPAVVLHEGSTLVVVANALRLLRYRYRPKN